MRNYGSVTLLSILFALPAHASDNAKASLALGGVSVSRERQTFEPAGGSSKTTHTTAVDLFGNDGKSSLPSIEFAFSIDKIVVYAYPNAPAGGRELWLGLKAGEATEIGFVAGTNHLAYNPANDNNFKTISADRVGLFVNQRIEVADLSFDLNLTPSYTISASTFSDASLNKNSGTFAVSADALWVWEVAGNIELNSGFEMLWSQSHDKTAGKETSATDVVRFGVKLAETRFFL